jgi:2-oxo-4-hydroxy-4-carboxy--5-ureidoimidazoline (OHCU) decarboxylase
MKISEINQLSKTDFCNKFYTVYGSKRWVRALESERPFLSLDDILKKADLYFKKCSKNDYFEGFSNFEFDNLEIYSQKIKNSEIDEEYVNLYNQYYEKFGFRFVILAFGKDFNTIKEKLKKRLLTEDKKIEFEKNVKELYKLMNNGIENNVTKGKIKIVGEYELRYYSY